MEKLIFPIILSKKAPPRVGKSVGKLNQQRDEPTTDPPTCQDVACTLGASTLLLVHRSTTVPSESNNMFRAPAGGLHQWFSTFLTIIIKLVFATPPQYQLRFFSLICRGRLMLYEHTCRFVYPVHKYQVSRLLSFPSSSNTNVISGNVFIFAVQSLLQSKLRKDC